MGTSVARQLRKSNLPFTIRFVRSATHSGCEQAAKRPAPRLTGAAPRAAVSAVPIAARFALVIAAFFAIFLPARSARAFGGVEAVGLVNLAGLCDPVGASAPAPAGPFVIVEDAETLVASALAAGITDPRGASMNAPLVIVVPDGTIAVLDEGRCEKTSDAPAVRQSSDDHRSPPDAAPAADVDPAMPSVVIEAPFVGVPEACIPNSACLDVPRSAHMRAVEHPPRLPRRSIRAFAVFPTGIHGEHGCSDAAPHGSRFLPHPYHPDAARGARPTQLPLRICSSDVTRLTRGRRSPNHRSGPSQSVRAFTQAPPKDLEK